MKKKVFIEKPDGSVNVVNDMSIKYAIGFSGSITNGLIVDPETKRIFYPIGKSIVVTEDISPFLGFDNAKIKQSGGLRHPSGRQKFITGHHSCISSIFLSASGRYLISGEKYPDNASGTLAEVILWNVTPSEKYQEVLRYKAHRGRTVSVRISPGDVYGASIGTEDLIIKNLDSGSLVSGKKKFSGQPFSPTCLSFCGERDDLVIVGGNDAVHIWRIFEGKYTIDSLRISFGKIKRKILNLLVLPKSSEGYTVLCGTSTGDIIKVFISSEVSGELKGSLRSCLIKNSPKKNDLNSKKFFGGVTGIIFIKGSNHVAVGTGCGNVYIIEDREDVIPKKRGAKPPGVPIKVSEPTKSFLKEIKMFELGEFPVTTICQYDRSSLFVGTSNGNILRLNILTSDVALVLSSSFTRIHSLIFPEGLDTICAASSDDGFRLWELETGTELLYVSPRESNQRNACNTAAFSDKGDVIYTGWADGSVRVFSPQSGHSLGVTGNVHPSGVTSLILASSGWILITGAHDGQIRTWSLSPSTKKLKLMCTIHQHKKKVFFLEAAKTTSDFISGSEDGTVIIWDVSDPHKLVRKRILVTNSSLVGCRYHSSDSQILTLSLDGQLLYWETFNGAKIREVIVGSHGLMTSMDLKNDFVLTGTASSIVKVRKYKAGNMIGMGQGFMGAITACKISPTLRFIVAATDDGAIITFEFNGQ